VVISESYIMIIDQNLNGFFKCHTKTYRWNASQAEIVDIMSPNFVPKERFMGSPRSHDHHPLVPAERFVPGAPA
jgi:hypothetical protein